MKVGQTMLSTDANGGNVVQKLLLFLQLVSYVALTPFVVVDNFHLFHHESVFLETLSEDITGVYTLT